MLLYYLEVLLWKTYTFGKGLICKSDKKTTFGSELDNQKSIYLSIFIMDKILQEEEILLITALMAQQKITSVCQYTHL